MLSKLHITIIFSFGCLDLKEIAEDFLDENEDGFNSAGVCTDIGYSTLANSTYAAETCQCSANPLDGSYGSLFIEQGDQNVEPNYIGYDIAGVLTGSLKNPTPGVGWAGAWVAFYRPCGGSSCFSTPEDLSSSWVLYFERDTSLTCEDYNPGWFTTQDTTVASGREARSGDVDRVAQFMFHPDGFGGSKARQGGFMAKKGGQGDLDGMHVDYIEVINAPWDEEVTINGVAHELYPGAIIDGADIEYTLSGVWTSGANFMARIVGTNPGRDGEEPEGVWSYDVDQSMGLQLMVAHTPEAQGVLEWDAETRVAKVVIPGSGLYIGIPVAEDGSFSVLRGELAGTVTDISATEFSVSIQNPPLGAFTYLREGSQ